MSPKIERITTSEAETLVLAGRFANCLVRGDVVALFGELGAGKTLFVRGVCGGLDVKDAVTSPTFTLINEYEGRLPLYHIDAYRLESADQLEVLGFDEICMNRGVVVVEWADRVIELVTDYEPVEIYLEHVGPTERKIKLKNLSVDIRDFMS